MKRSVLIYGLILGVIITGNMVYMATLCYNNPQFVSNDVLGYAAMLVVFSLIFFGIRNFRNKYNNQQITFGQAFKLGAMIAFLGSTMYVGVWLFYHYLFIPDFMDKYTVHVLYMAEQEGATATELAARAKEMATYKEWYKNPLFVILLSYAEVLIPGLIVALVSSLILRKGGRANSGVGNVIDAKLR